MREVMQNNYQEYDSGNDINFSEERPYTAVVTSDGLFISHYLDDINKVRIYRAGDEESELIAIRPIPGKECSGIARWKKFPGVLSDCSFILVSDINSASRSILLNSGILSVTVHGFV